jgi:hypothetical protein
MHRLQSRCLERPEVLRHYEIVKLHAACFKNQEAWKRVEHPMEIVVAPQSDQRGTYAGELRDRREPLRMGEVSLKVRHIPQTFHDQCTRLINDAAAEREPSERNGRHAERIARHLVSPSQVRMRLRLDGSASRRWTGIAW